MKVTTPIIAALAAAALATLALSATAQGEVFEHNLEVHEFESGGMHVFPERVNAKVGQTVKFIVSNPAENSVSHDIVICAEAPKPDATCAPANTWGFTPLIPPGETREVTFTPDKAGTFEYFCRVVGHKTAAPGMVGTLTVTGGTVEEKESPSLAALGSILALSGVALALRRR